MSSVLVLLVALLPLQVLSLSAPLHTSSRWILDGNNARVKLRCVNWAAHLETNTPEGLQHASLTATAQRIASLPFNCVRLTYSIDLALEPDVSIAESFSQAADVSGAPKEQLTNLYSQAVEMNQWLGNATRIEVLGKTVEALADAGLAVILDNHVSKATWCCNLTDGNGWWKDAPGYVDANSRYFDTDEWLEGIAAMAEWAAGHSNVIGMGIRNEIRGIPIIQDGLGHDVWYDRVARGFDAVLSVNKDVFAVVGGTLGATDFSFLRTKPLDRSKWEGRVVWEYHVYSYSVGYTTDNCNLFKTQMGAAAGYLLQQDQSFTGPLWVSELGFGMSGGPNMGLSDQDWKYFDCLKGYLESNDADWSIWAVQGDYYVRDGIVSYDESYGLLDKNWTSWRNPKIESLLDGMWNMTQGPE